MQKKLIRITTVPISLKLLLTGQMKYMKEQDFEVIMVSADGPEIKEVETNEGCLHKIIPFTRQISPLKDLNSLWLLIKLIKAEKPDIIHTHTPKAGLIGMLAAKICGVKLKIHTIAGLPLMTTTGGKRKLLEFIEKLTYWSADFILPNSNSIMQFVKEHKFTNDHKLDMIGYGSSNGIDLSRFCNESIQVDQLNTIKETIQYDSSNIYILSVGRIVKDKGIVEIVDSFLKLRDYNSCLRLILLGPMEEERKEESLPTRIMEEIESNANIIHINWSNSVEYYMQISNLLVHASYREGFPNVPLQAGAMGCPIICSNIPGNIDIVSDKKTGLYFEVGNTKDLIEKIEFAITNPDVINKYATDLQKQIKSKYSRSYIHQELLKFYNEKLASS